MARQHPYKNPLGAFCLCMLMLFCAVPAHAQENNARKVLKKAPVQYPSILKSKGIGGGVRLGGFVKPDGSVKVTQGNCGHPILLDSSLHLQNQREAPTGKSLTRIGHPVVFLPHPATR